MVVNFFNSGVSAVSRLISEIFRINGPARKKLGYIAVNKRQCSGCGFRLGRSCGCETSQMLDRKAKRKQSRQFYRVKKKYKGFKRIFRG